MSGGVRLNEKQVQSLLKAANGRGDIDTMALCHMAQELLEGGSRSEMGWVIERGDSDVSRPLYWTGGWTSLADSMPCWDYDNAKAVRFSRKEDAQMTADYLEFSNARIAEHAWDSPVASETTVTVEYDLSPAMVEGRLRDKLVDLGWAPPDQNAETKEKAKRWQKIADQRAIEVADLKHAAASENRAQDPAQSVPDGMWYFTFYCEDRAAVERARVAVDAPRQFTCGVTGIDKKFKCASLGHVWVGIGDEGRVVCDECGVERK